MSARPPIPQGYSYTSSYTTQLVEAEVTPDVLPSTGTLQGPIEIVYPEVHIQGGEIVNRLAAQEVPTIEFTAAEPFELYTIIMTDPDLMMKNDKINGQVRHWVQPGIKFEASGKATFTEPVITEYLAPSPGLGTGKHRYVFLLAKQFGSNPMTNDLTSGGPSADLKSRMGFDAAKYCADAKLEIVGCTYMLVQPDVGATLLDAKLMAQSAVNKVVGK